MTVFQSVFSRINGLVYATNYRHCLVNRISSSAFQYSPKLSVEEQLGIKPRPKRPTTPFIKFIAQNRTSIVQQNPQANPKDVIKLLSEEWRNVDEKLKLQLQEDYKKEWLQYTQDCKEYDKLLSPADREEIAKAKQEAKSIKEKKQLKKHRDELGCPKKPGSSFVLFMKTKLPERGETPFKEFQKKIKEDWDNMPELQKDRFEKLYQKDMEEYRTKMTLWMKKMDEEGHQVTKQKEKPEGPKRPPSAYIHFMRTKLLERGETPFREYQKKIRDDWEKLSPDEKKPYEDMYKKELEEYKHKLAEDKSHPKTKAQVDVLTTSSTDDPSSLPSISETENSSVKSGHEKTPIIGLPQEKKYELDDNLRLTEQPPSTMHIGHSRDPDKTKECCGDEDLSNKTQLARDYKSHGKNIEEILLIFLLVSSSCACGFIFYLLLFY